MTRGRDRCPHAALVSVLVVMALGTTVVGLRSVGRAAAAPDRAAITVTPTAAGIGDTLQVGLSGWPVGVVTAAVCGNGAKRGSSDCDQIGAASIGVRAAGSETLTVTVQAPPVGCPCVVRAATITGDLVRVVPVDIRGVPTGVDLAPVGQVPSASALAVSASIRSAQVPWPRSWYPEFAGPTERVLVIRLRNTGDVTLTGLRVVGSVGRRRSEGEPINGKIPPLAPRAATRVTVPFTLAAPVWGEYRVSGSIYGLDAPVDFSATTSTDPWALQLALPLLLIVVAEVLRQRERARRRALADTPVDARQADLVFPQSSLGVGDSDVDHCETPAYSQRDAGSGRADGARGDAPTGVLEALVDS